MKILIITLIALVALTALFPWIVTTFLKLVVTMGIGFLIGRYTR